MKSDSIPSGLHSDLGQSPAVANLYRFEGYELDRLQWQVRWQGEVLPMNPKAFDLLLHLVEARPRVVGKDELMNLLWPNQFVDENNLAQQASLLRKALSKHSSGRKIIETVPGRGYQFAAFIEEPQASPAPEPLLNAEQSFTRVVLEEVLISDTPETPLLSSRRTNRRSIYIAVVVVVLALLGLGGVAGWRWWQNRTAGAPVEAVLMPLEGTTGDAALDHVLDDSIRSDLSQSPFVTIATRSLFENTLKQMQHKPSDPVTETVAREVCERINNQAVVHTELARDGQHFLLTSQANSCVNDVTLASATEEADRAENLRLAVNRLASRIRQKLGESRSSIARFNTPRLALETSSLDALEAASVAAKLGNEDKAVEAIAMEKQAIAYDPNFAMAYYGLSSLYINVGDMKNARGAIQKAYDLRSSCSPLVQFTIASRYGQLVTRDLYSAEKSDVGWTELYPRQYSAWNALDTVREGLGEWSQAAEAARKTIELRPDIVLYYGDLEQDQLFSGDVQGSQVTTERALAISPDYEPGHLDLARIAYVNQSAGLYQQQIDWLEKHPKSPLMLSGMAELAIAQGRFAEAKRWVEQAADFYRQQGDPSSAGMIEKVIALEFLGTEDLKDGLELYRRSPVDPEDSQELLTEVFVGDVTKAEALLREEITGRPNDTRLLHWYAPLVEGWSAMKAGHPDHALEILNQPGTLSNYADIDFARGQAYLAAKQPQAAEAQFRKIVDRPYRDQSFISSVAWIQLARALSAEGKYSASRSAYEHFLQIWQHADSSTTLYQAAKNEEAALH